MQHDNPDHYTIAADEIIAKGIDLKVSILTLTAGQCVPWHHHSNVSDRFFCMEGPMVVETRVPLARIDKRAIGFRLWPAGQDHGTHDHPVELAPADDAFLYVFVVVDAPQQQMESHVIKKPAAAATVARPKARYADQTLDSSFLHRGDEHLGRLREKPRRFEDDFRPSRNTKRLNDGIYAGQRAFHRSHLERVAGNFFEFGVTNTYSSG